MIETIVTMFNQEKGSHHWMHISHPEESTNKLIYFYEFVYNE